MGPATLLDVGIASLGKNRAPFKTSPADAVISRRNKPDAHIITILQP